MVDGLRRAAVVWIVSQCLACHWVFPYSSGGDDAGRDAPPGDARPDRPMAEALPDTGLADRPTPDGPPFNPDLLDLSVGAAHTCAIKSSGELFCWGWNEWGQLGTGDTTSIAARPKLPTLSGVVSVSAGVNHTCALVQQRLFCWGYNGSGHLGTGGTKTTEPLPLEVKTLTGVTQVATGNFHTCALAAGDVWCWGANAYGEVTGTGTDVAPRRVNLPCKALQIALGTFHSCARCDGSVHCWGRNDVGQLGDGTTKDRSTPGLVALANASSGDPVGIWSGAGSTCVARASGEAACWGWNSHGQVDGTAIGTNRTQPTPVLRNASTKLSDVIELAPGERHTCAVVNPGRKVVCWGSNLLGQLGDGTTVDAVFPQPVGVANVIRLSGMSRTTCALLPKGIKCWGHHGRGQIGDGQDGYVLTPLGVALPKEAVDLDAGERHTCAVLADGGTFCWGDNASGQCGFEPGTYVLSQPTAVSWPMKELATSISAGHAHSCAGTGSNRAYCWGANESGQLGDGTTTPRHQPAVVRPATTSCATGALPNVAAVGAGRAHTCLMSVLGVVHCAGSDSLGQLGDPASSLASACPKVVAVNGKALAVGDTMSCVLTGAELVCWGTFGTGFTSNGPTKVAVIAGTGPLGIGRDHGCLVSAGAALCWGASSHDRLGNKNATSVPSTAAKVLDKSNVALTDVTSVSASPGTEWTGAHSCAAAKGGAYCWGWNAYGQLGDGSRNDQPNAGVPIVAKTGATIAATKVATGPHHSCALDTSGAVWCWGYNGAGAVGAAALPVTRTPTAVPGL